MIKIEGKQETEGISQWVRSPLLKDDGSENTMNITNSEWGTGSIKMPLVKPKNELVRVIKKINKTLGISGTINFDDGNDDRESKRPPKQKETTKLDTSTQDKVTKLQQLMKNNDARWIEGIQQYQDEIKIEC